MGRKIPGRKHKGVKDPLVQKAVREEKLKTKINAPPSNPDDQEIPKSLENIIRLKKMASDQKFIHKKKNLVRSKLIDTSRLTRKEFKLPGMKKPDKPLPNLVQWVGETEETFLKRIDEATQSLINEVEFEQQFGVHVRRNSDTGDIEGVETAVPDEIDTLIKNNRLNEKGKNKRKKAKNKDVTSGESYMNSKQRKKQKALERKQLIKVENDEKIRLVDNVKFGEVVHRPPVITTRPKHASEINRPGVKGNLLLHKVLYNKDSSRDKKFRLSNMSPLARQKHEVQRNNVVELYRKIKAQNFKKSR